MSPEEREGTNTGGDTKPEPVESEFIAKPETWVGGWISPLLVVCFTLGWCLLIYLLVGTRVRTWQFGTVPYVPGQSIFSTEQPRATSVPHQVEYPTRTSGGSNATR